MSFYRIHVVEEEFGFALFNHEGIAGDRLWHGENPKNPAELWPFRKGGSQWMHFEDKGEAEIAAQKLQTYLDARDGGMKKSTKKNAGG